VGRLTRNGWLIVRTKAVAADLQLLRDSCFTAGKPPGNGACSMNPL
jgi:hypothetical protein